MASELWTGLATGSIVGVPTWVCITIPTQLYLSIVKATDLLGHTHPYKCVKFQLVIHCINFKTLDASVQCARLYGGGVMILYG